MRKVFTKTFSLFGLIWVICINTAMTQSVKVAVAANLQPVMRTIKTDFKSSTGVNIDIISGPSGNLAAQIRNGAPFDVFLSADTDFPLSLQHDGFGLTPVKIYAQGVLIICSKQRLDLSKWQQLVLTAGIKKIAIANPAIAPYGRATKQALNQMNMYDKLKTKLVFGESISQVNTYVITGTVQAGFTTLSLIKDASNKTPLYYSVISPKSYTPIEQGMLLLKHARGNASAEKFYRYILSSSARKIFKQFGYHI
ncbi:molybdate ABC transporter substrate-binding protein [Mucilaginibacter litoreus]|uniref:Molybdate ABC transporter substrate-binding protein n=1 Tax=Mucilaginibacter litoreus TaxID=1048221 RepID=A0ABW3AXJ3_9SPHI